MKRIEESVQKNIQKPGKIKVGVGERVRKIRHSNTMKLEEVAELTGLPALDIEVIEKGKKLPSLFACYKLAEAFQITVEEIIGIYDIATLRDKVYELEEINYPIEERTYTYSEYLEWPGQWELLYGAPYNMTYANTLHQRVVSRLCAALGSHLGSYFGSNNHEVFTAPFEVNLSNGNEKEIVLQPDITVIEGRYKLNERGLGRVPELVVEVLSPETTLRDRTTKFEIYKESGVQEYWIADPVDGTIEVYTFMGEEEVSVTHIAAEGILQSEYLLDFKIPLRLLFQ